MKAKKLLSIGAMSLVIACSTSVAALAVDTSSVSSDDKNTITSIASQYKNGGNVVGKINKNTKVSDIVNPDAVKDKLDNYQNGKRLLKYLDLDDGTINSNLKSVLNGIIVACDKTSDPNAHFKLLKGQIDDVADKVLAFDNATGQDRANKEKELKSLMNTSNYNLSLGKNASGVTTICIEDKKGNIQLQMNKNNAQAAVAVFDSMTLNELKFLVKYWL